MKMKIIIDFCKKFILTFFLNLRENSLEAKKYFQH